MSFYSYDNVKKSFSKLSTQKFAILENQCQLKGKQEFIFVVWFLLKPTPFWMGPTLKVLMDLFLQAQNLWNIPHQSRTCHYFLWLSSLCQDKQYVPPFLSLVRLGNGMTRQSRINLCCLVVIEAYPLIPPKLWMSPTLTGLVHFSRTCHYL